MTPWFVEDGTENQSYDKKETQSDDKKDSSYDCVDDLFEWCDRASEEAMEEIDFYCGEEEIYGSCKWLGDTYASAMKGNEEAAAELKAVADMITEAFSWYEMTPWWIREQIDSYEKISD